MGDHNLVPSGKVGPLRQAQLVSREIQLPQVGTCQVGDRPGQTVVLQGQTAQVG